MAPAFVRPRAVTTNRSLTRCTEHGAGVVHNNRHPHRRSVALVGTVAAAGRGHDVPVFDQRRGHSDRPVERPLFLLGAPRSGTSLLYKALCLHPDAAWISNWVRRFPSVPQVAVLNRLAGRLPDRQREVWFGGASSNAYVYATRRSLTARIFPMPVEGETVFAGCGIKEDGADAGPDQQQALRDAFAAVRRYGGGRVLVCKRIANNRRIPVLLSAFPDARFVEIVRDGRAVALSLSRVDWWESSVVWWYGATPRQWAAEGRDPWDLCARNWTEELRVIDAGLQCVGEDQVLRISYEAFLEAPLETLGRVATFAGLPGDEYWTDRLHTLSFPDRNNEWTTTLDADVVRRITTVQAEQLASHGYLAT